MSECEKRNCGYYYQLPDEDYPRCHWEDDGFPPPVSTMMTTNPKTLMMTSASTPTRVATPTIVKEV